MAIGATAIQIFTKAPSQWRAPPLDPDTARAFRDAVSASGLRAVVAHDAYLINLASPDPALRRRSGEALAAELGRCAALGIPYLVSHPGHHREDPARGLARNAEGVAAALEAAPGPVALLLETTAGGGTALGSRFEELARLRDMVPTPLRERVGFCADTCHLFAAGYDLVRDYDGVWEAWDRILGLEHLACLHLNDSKTPFGSRRDRHAAIAEGTLGPEPFRRIMKDPRFRRTIKILETPKGEDPVAEDRRMLRRLRAYARRAR